MFVYLLRKRYSFLLLPPCNVGPNSRMHDWKRTVSIEIEQFLGLLLMMGILKKPLIAQYWSKNRLYSTPLFGSVIIGAVLEQPEG